RCPVGIHAKCSHKESRPRRAETRAQHSKIGAIDVRALQWCTIPTEPVDVTSPPVPIVGQTPHPALLLLHHNIIHRVPLPRGVGPNLPLDDLAAGDLPDPGEELALALL